MRWSRALVRVVVFAGVSAVWSSPPCVFAQGEGEPRAAVEPAENVVIKREPLQISDPHAYRTPMRLAPVKSLVLTAPVDGYIRGISVGVGKNVGKESEMIRLDDERSNILLRRAKANLQAAKVEKKIAQAKKDDDLVALADARLDSAKAELDLVQYEADKLVIRAPFKGEVNSLDVVEGQFVRAGAALATLDDSSHLVVEVPAEHGAAKVGGTLELTIEENSVKGKIEAIVPLSSRFAALRELCDTLASVIVDFDNAQGKFRIGQAVYSGLVPTAPVTSVPTGSVSNQPDGNRQVQVLRANIVRNVPVAIHGKIGTSRVFVSGAFQAGDELIVSSSRELSDGASVKALAAAARGEAGAKTGGAAAKPGDAPAKKSAPVTGF